MVTGFIEGKSQRDISDKDEGKDAHITDPPCLEERCLITVVLRQYDMAHNDDETI